MYPELIAERLVATYERKGYTREWINQRLMAISARKELTDEWKDCGIEKGMEYASKHAEQYRNVCPFCHQPIVQRETMEVLQSYSKFLSDKTQRECSLEWKNLSAFQKKY